MTTGADPNNPAGSATPASPSGAAAAAAPAGSPTDVTALVRAAEQRASIAEQRYRELSQSFGRQSQEVGELRARVGAGRPAADPFADPGNGHAAPVPGIDPAMY